MESCPSYDELLAYMRSEGDGATSQVETHVDNCTACLQTLERIAKASEAKLEDYQVHEPAIPKIPGFDLLERIGRGGYGTVWKARQINLKRIVAIKILRLDGESASRSLQKFVREAEIIAKIDHPNIVKILDVSADGPLVYYVMEYLPEGSLASRLEGIAWDIRKAGRLIADLARGAQAAHDQGVVHRDIKPANVLLEQSGIPKLADFGVAKMLESGEELTATEAFVGTPAYMSPEQASGRSRNALPVSDVFSLGIVFYELITGVSPFNGGSFQDISRRILHEEPVAPRRRRKAISRDLETIVMRCLAKEPERRYRSPSDLANDIELFLEGKPIQARPLSSVANAYYRARRNPAVTLASFIAISLGIGLAVTGIVLLQNRQEAKRKLEKDSRLFMADARVAEGQGDYAAALSSLDKAESALLSGNTNWAIIEEVRVLKKDVVAKDTNNKIEKRLKAARLLQTAASPDRSGFAILEAMREYQSCFDEIGVALNGSDTQSIANQILQSPISQSLRVAIRDWCWVTRGRDDLSPISTLRIQKSRNSSLRRRLSLNWSICTCDPSPSS